MLDAGTCDVGGIGVCNEGDDRGYVLTPEQCYEKRDAWTINAALT
jgi:hypothetical protein